MDWSSILLPLLSAIPPLVFVLLLLRVTKTHVQVYLDGQPGRYRVCLENLDDVASRQPVVLELRLRGPDIFSGGPRNIGFAPWPGSVKIDAQDRTIVLEAKGLGRHERWLFEVDTKGGEQALEASCRIGTRELPVIASDGVAEFADQPSASPLTAWTGLALAPVLYLTGLSSWRWFHAMKPALEWLDAAIAAGVLLLSWLGLWVMHQSQQTTVAHPSLRPAYPPEPPAKSPSWLSLPSRRNRTSKRR